MDPYYEDPQIVLFKSTKVFDKIDTVKGYGDPLNLDMCVKMVAYNTKENE